MPVPEAIRKVQRPANTIVCDYGEHCRNPDLRYAVRKRIGAVCRNGKSYPVNGPVVGHIINYRYVPVQADLDGIPQFLSYGAAALVRSVSGDLYTDLLSCFSPNDAVKILCIAMLRVLDPGIKAKRYSTEMRFSFLSVWYPQVQLSRNTVCTFLQKLGMAHDRRISFNGLRLSQVCKEHHVAIDGTLKQDTGRCNSFSAYSHKAKVRGIRDISILYAFDINTLEPVCAEVFQGNSIDAHSYSAFIRDNHIERGFILADKGFPHDAAAKEFAEHPELHYLNPLKRNDKLIEKYELLKFEEQLYGIDGLVVCKKVSLPDGTFLYSFKDEGLRANEGRSFLNNTRRHQSFDQKEYASRNERFGLIVFESDVDLTCEQVWRCYMERWMLELVFAQFKGDDELTTTNVQSDFSIQGSEFINFIASIMTVRITRKMEAARLLDNDSYGDIMRDLERVRRSVQAPDDKLPRRDDHYWDQNPIKGTLTVMEKLGLCEPREPVSPPKRRGRPKKKAEPEPQTEAKAEDTASSSSSPAAAPKRGPGRPRIHQKPDPNAPKRSPGRPRIHPKPDPNAPKRPVGRPRIHPKPDPNTPKRGRGRPRIHPEPDPNAPKPKRGRPLKNPLPPSGQ